ncbi:MAG: UvrD-helicase domain-containing protein [Acetatifactor sp.]|nr:UvrD-helicase domain-containing protein [Acetatifactor sp.]
MKVLEYLFKRNRIKPKQESQVSGRCVELIAWENYIKELQKSNHYVSRKEYTAETEKYADVMKLFISMDENDTLEFYCEKNGFDADRAKNAYMSYQSIDALVQKANDKYISQKMDEEKGYLDTILKEVDPAISLDDDQRRVVLSDEDYSLVIAGAGAGKTTTVAAKVKYLVEKQGVDPGQILIISFTNKAVNELKARINKDLNIPCPIATFHSTGNAILHKNDPEKLNIVDGSKLYYCVQSYFKDKVLRDPSVVNSLILFFASYFDAPYEGDDINNFFNYMANANYATMRSELDDFKEEVIDRNSKKKITIQNEIVRSVQEVEIANFLYLNSIDYVYEPVYPYHILMSRKPYTPDFMITQGEHVAYIEHFGITEDGKNFLYDEEVLSAYKKAINDKICLHRKHGTELLYTFSSFRDGRSISQHLEESLLKHGFELKRRSNEEIVKKLVSSEENKYISRLVFLVINFIRNFKVNGYDERDFDKLSRKTSNVRTKLFLDICHACFLEYKKLLVEKHAVDFEDMINESARVLCEVKEMRQKLDFQYLIVDEYQDISRQRFDLVKSFSEVTDAKIIAVGDDWQSIYAFSGSDITLFTKFEEKMGYAKLMKIVRTYRNSQEVIDIAGNFIQKNASQIQKSLVSPKHIDEPVIIYTYDSATKAPNSDRRSGVNYAIAYAVQTALEQIIAYDKEEGRDTRASKILLLGRFGFDGDRLTRTGLFEYINRGAKVKSVKYPELDITYMTAHASKGLGYDNVIVVNGRNETYGFPAKIEDDPVLSLVVREDTSMQYAEERRLFYVAMTRTKNRVYFIAPEQNPSEFLLEIKKEYKNVYLRGKWSEGEPVLIGKKKCPICGFPMQLKYKTSYGLRLYLCTNEPEVCSFMTNNISGKKLSIMKCSECQDGYLVIKTPKKGGECFLGCTNYSKDNRGCNNTMSKHEYYLMMGHELSEPDEPIRQTADKKNVKENWEQKILDSNAAIGVDAERFPEYKNHSSYEIAETILCALVHISDKYYFGVSVLIRVLRGSQSKSITQHKLYAVPEYNSLSDMSREDLNAAIYWLIDKHYIIKTKGRYPVLHITNEGLHYKEHMTPRKLKSLVAALNADEDEKRIAEEDIF